MVKKYAELYLDARRALLPTEGQFASNVARELICAASGKTAEQLISDRDLYASEEICELAQSFVRRRVADNVGPVAVKDLHDTLPVAHGADEHDEVQLRVRALQLHLDVVCIVLIYIEDHQPLRCMGCDLAAELASDRSASTGHQDGFSADITENLIHVYLDRVSSQKILHCHILHLAERYFSCDKLIDTWQYLHLAFGLFADV